MDAVKLTGFSFAYPPEAASAALARADYVACSGGEPCVGAASKPTLDIDDLRVPVGSFTLLAGMTGCGKSTLLQCLKAELAPQGLRQGIVEVLGSELTITQQDSHSEDPGRIGFVMQDAEAQIVTDTVGEELAFGLENLALPSAVIQRRVAEIAAFFGISGWFDKKTSELSGGQKQLLNLAAIMTMHPVLLLLDEPTSQLDPLASKEFLSALYRVNQELGITILIAEHHLSDLLPLCETVVFLDEGRRVFDGGVQDFIVFCTTEKPLYLPALPAATQLALTLAAREDKCQPMPEEGLELPTGAQDTPTTVRDARNLLQAVVCACKDAAIQKLNSGAAPGFQELLSGAETERASAPVLTTHDLWFSYGKEHGFVLKGVDVAARRGRIHAILGSNGSGKSTLLFALAGVRKPQRGRVRVEGKLRRAALPQDVKAILIRDTVREDLEEGAAGFGSDREAVQRILEEFRLTHLVNRHPYDISAGEQQKVALAKLLLTNPDILLLDEPTKGIDAAAKQELGILLRNLVAQGRSIIIASHDLAFTAEYADECVLLFNGQLAGAGKPKEFFDGNLFYATDINRITRGILPGCVTLDDALGRALG